MNRAWLTALFCASLASPADRKQVESLIQQVRDASSAEPALLSVDTLIRLSTATVKLHPKKSLEAARDAGSLLLTLPDPETRGAFGVKVTEVLRQADPEEARRFMLAMEPRRTSGTYRDTKAEALDLVARYWIPRDPKRALEVISEALGAGAFRAECIKELMDHLTTEDPPAVPAVFGLMLAAFPEDDATDRDCLLLLRRAAQAAPFSQALAVEAARKVLRALESKRFREDPARRIEGHYSLRGREITVDGGRDAILLEAGAFLAAYSPESFAALKEKFGRWDLENVPPAEALGFATAESLVVYPRTNADAQIPLAHLILMQPPVSLMEVIQPGPQEPIEIAVEKARQPADDGNTVGLRLVHIAMRRDATPSQRTQIAGEAIDEAEKDPKLSRRLWVYEGLLPYLWQHGNKPLAIKAGHAMAHTVAQFCAKPDDECLTAQQRFAEDLFNFEIAPDDLGIGDPSLRARTLILKLKEMALPPSCRRPPGLRFGPVQSCPHWNG